MLLLLACNKFILSHDEAPMICCMVWYYGNCVKHGMDWIGMDRHGMELNGTDWYGIEWIGMAWNVFEWIGLTLTGM